MAIRAFKFFYYRIAFIGSSGVNQDESVACSDEVTIDRNVQDEGLCDSFYLHDNLNLLCSERGSACEFIMV